MIKIKIKTFVFLIGIFTLVSSILFAWLILDLKNKSAALEDIQYNRFLMFEKSDELIQSSDDLSRFARTYINTGDKKYKDIYFRILDIRNGLAPRPSNRSLIYWNLSESQRNKRYPLKNPEALKTQMLRLPYLPYEFEKLAEAEHHSNELVRLEIEAFNAMEGLFKDDAGKYRITAEPNPSLAIELLTSRDYHLFKEKIMLPIDDFLTSLSNRTKQSISKQTEWIDHDFKKIFILLALDFIVFFILVALVKRRILKPIKTLNKAIIAFNNNGEIIPEEHFCDDELGLMMKNFYQMKKILDDDLLRLHFALFSARQGWVDVNPQTGEFLVSDEYAQLLGYAPNEFETDMQKWQQNIHPDDLASVLASFQQCLSVKGPIEQEYRRLNKQEDWVWLHIIAEVVQWDNEDKPSRIIAVNTDVTVRKQQELREKIRNRVLELLVKNQSLIIILTTIIELIEKEDPNIICSILLLDKDGKYFSVGVAPGLPDFFNNAVKEIEIGHGVGSCGTAAYTRKRVIVQDIQTHPYWAAFKEIAAKANLASCWSEPIIGAHDKLLGTFAIYHHKPSIPVENDFKLIEFVSQLATIAIERSQINEQVLLSARVFSDTHEGITITDPNGIIVDVNPAFAEITGYSREEVIGENPNILSSGKQPPEFFEDMWQSIYDHDFWQGEIWNRKKNGELYAELLSISALKNKEGKTLHYVGLFSDITSSKRQQEKLNLMAHYDELTQLPNRALFTDRFHQAIAHSKRTATQLAVCFLDLDNFKPVNDHYGHEVGDQLLVEVARRITANVREEDTVSRQGGDEFALLLGDLDSYEQCKQTLTRIHHSLAEPYLIENHLHKLTASSGVTLYPVDRGDIDTLLRHADQAMYQAKLAGKNRYYLFNTKQDQQAIHKHNRLEEIQRAFNNCELQLYYQPKVNMKTGKVFGVEALIRWLHPQQGLIPPLDFLPIIEGTKLEIKLGNWVMREAVSQLAAWNEQGIKLEVSVNISSYHLQSASLIAELDNALAQFPKVDSTDFQLEILESSALNDLEAIRKIVKICRQTLGVNVALDDFGTGYSSLAHIRNLSVNTIKIDQSFVRDMLEDPSDYAIIDGIIGLADSFDREIIAEGVETTEHGLMLLLMGCDKAQGYGIARPMPASEIPIWLNQYQVNTLWIEAVNKDSSLKDNKINIFKLTTDQWMRHFTTNVQSSPKDIAYWPIMDKTKCPCGTWIKRAQKEALFNVSWLEKLHQAHDTFHNMAYKLLLNYGDDKIDQARDGLTKLQQSFDKMSRVIELYH